MYAFQFHQTQFAIACHSNRPLWMTFFSSHFFLLRLSFHLLCRVEFDARANLCKKLYINYRSCCAERREESSQHCAFLGFGSTVRLALNFGHCIPNRKEERASERQNERTKKAQKPTDDSNRNRIKEHTIGVNEDEDRKNKKLNCKQEKKQKSLNRQKMDR